MSNFSRHCYSAGVHDIVGQRLAYGHVPPANEYRFGEFEVDVAAYSCGVAVDAFDLARPTDGPPACSCWSADKNWYHTTKSRGGCGDRTYLLTLMPASERPSSKSGGCWATRASRPQLVETFRARAIASSHRRSVRNARSRGDTSGICTRDLSRKRVITTCPSSGQASWDAERNSLSCVVRLRPLDCCL